MTATMKTKALLLDGAQKRQVPRFLQAGVPGGDANYGIRLAGVTRASPQ
jgi:hypothetical protein